MSRVAYEYNQFREIQQYYRGITRQLVLNEQIIKKQNNELAWGVIGIIIMLAAVMTL